MAVWPKQLWPEALTVLHLENGKETPGRVGHNTDAVHSTDNGCMQINNYWQFKRPGSIWTDYNSIYDPVFNAKVAYSIYQRNGSTWKPWYSVCTPGHKQVFSNARCGR